MRLIKTYCANLRIVELTLVLLVTGCSQRPLGIDRDVRGTALEHPDFLTRYAETRRFSRGWPRSVRITPDNGAILYLRSAGTDPVRNLYEFDVGTKTERVLLSADQLLSGQHETLSVEESARRERMRQTARGIAAYQLSRDGRRVLVPLSGQLFVLDRPTGEVTRLPDDGGFAIDARFSPDGGAVACVRDGDLYVIDIATGVQRRLTTRVDPDIRNGVSEFVAQEEMGRFHGYWWSPDSRQLAYQQTDTSMVETLYISDALNPQTPPHSWPYPRPGETNASVRLGVIPVDGGDTTWIDWDHDAYEYLATVRWQKDAPLTLVVENRPQTELAILTADTRTGQTRLIHREDDPAWINLDQAMPRWIPSRGTFLWTTDRHGERALEERTPNQTDAVMIAPSKTANFRGFISITDDGRRLAIYTDRPGPPAGHPTERYVAQLVYDPSTGRWSNPVAHPSADPASQSAVFSRDHALCVQWSQSMAGHQPYTIRDESGNSIGQLPSVAQEPSIALHVELARVNLDESFCTAVIRPGNFLPSKRYPVIESVYGGPTHPMVTVASSAYLRDQWLADQGFIVVRIDGRGTPNRGRSWERAIKGNLIHLPLQDHAKVITELGRRHHEMDLSRVGIVGWSFGGYFSAMAVMQQPDVYHAAVAGAPVCDWIDYDTHYTERYLGMPQDNPGGYQYSSVLHYTDQLRRPLMLIHGTTDDNVYFTHSLKISNALLHRGIEHRFLPLSNFTHMVADPEVTVQINRAIVRFMHENLGGPG